MSKCSEVTLYLPVLALLLLLEVVPELLHHLASRYALQENLHSPAPALKR